MSCTTLLVGKNASYDGSTMIARNDDSGADARNLRSADLHVRAASDGRHGQLIRFIWYRPYYSRFVFSVR